MERIGTAMHKLVNRDLRKLPSAQPKALTLFKDRRGKQKLASMLSQCFQVYPAFGRSGDAAESIVALFMLVLSDYPIEKITEAFKFHLQHSKQFPVPADIAMVIRRGNRPPFSEAAFTYIGKKHPQDRDADEWKYLADYKEFMTTGHF